MVTAPPSGSSRIVVLWPRGAPDAVGREDDDVPKLFVYPAEREMERGGTREEAHESAREEARESAREQAHESTREAGRQAAGETIHAAVIVLPGGGYTHLATEKEGAVEARWLNEHGVTAFVLEYRLGPRYHFPAPMLDAARAIRYVRSHAHELQVDKDKIGLWGFSAGGHLAGYLATVNDPGRAGAPDPIERVSDRPDFAILSYGRFTLDPSIPRKTSLEGLIGLHPTAAVLDAVSVDRHVTRSTAPCFIFSTTADQTVNSLNATAFYDALKRAGVPAELHIFERGPHGMGMAQGWKSFPELALYPTLLANWMEMHGWMGAGS